MNRLVTRLVLSHALVAVVAGVATMLIVRQLAPLVFDERVRRAGQGAGVAALLRQQFASAVDQSLLTGVLVGVVAATVTEEGSGTAGQPSATVRRPSVTGTLSLIHI